LPPTPRPAVFVRDSLLRIHFVQNDNQTIVILSGSEESFLNFVIRVKTGILSRRFGFACLKGIIFRIMAESKKTTPTGNILAGLFCVAMGIFPLLATFDIGPLDHNDINGPAWLGFASGGVFIAAGLAVMVGQSAPLANGVLAILAIAGLAAIGNWIAFGAGERACSGGVSLSWFWSGAQLSDMACRIPFGLGAIVGDGFLLIASVTLLQKALGGPPRLAKLRRASEIVMLLALAPFLLILAIIMFVQVGGGALWTRVATGAWPRNEGFIARQNAKGLLNRIRQKKPHP
jgi:hypothetical protein